MPSADASNPCTACPCLTSACFCCEVPAPAALSGGCPQAAGAFPESAWEVTSSQVACSQGLMGKGYESPAQKQNFRIPLQDLVEVTLSKNLPESHSCLTIYTTVLLLPALYQFLLAWEHFLHKSLACLCFRSPSGKLYLSQGT